MVAISQSTFSNAFSWRMSLVLYFLFEFHRILFLRLQLAINQHWWQAIIRINAEPFRWRIYVALGEYEWIRNPQNTSIVTYRMMTSPNRNIFRVTGPLRGEFTGHRWIPLTKASDAEIWCFLWSMPEQTVEWTIETLVIWDAITPIMTPL